MTTVQYEETVCKGITCKGKCQLKIRWVNMARKRALYSSTKFSKLDDLLLIFLQLSAAHSFRSDEKSWMPGKAEKRMKDGYREVSLLIFPANYRQAGIFRAGRGFDQSFMCWTMDPINTTEEPFFLSVRRILYTRARECQQRFHLLLCGGKFFNKEKSELQRHREKEGGGMREEEREREKRERYRNERTGR